MSAAGLTLNEGAAGLSAGLSAGLVSVLAPKLNDGAVEGAGLESSALDLPNEKAGAGFASPVASVGLAVDLPPPNEKVAAGLVVAAGAGVGMALS